MVLDKIYLHSYHPARDFPCADWQMHPVTTKHLGVEATNIEYIRKDALLEWAKEHYDWFKSIFNVTPASVVGGKMDAYKEFIEKLESL